ncbi:MAG: hypothetical protein U0S49_04765 [Rhodospirillales bacterium]|nr:hypothetical protein [Rhodospirillales bacterium]
MALLHQIQESVVQEDADLGSVLLKLRLLASRLGSGVLEEWVKHESEGYPEDVAVPSYRIVAMSFKGTFSGAFGTGIQNAPIPLHLVEKHAGKKWARYEVRQSISSVCELLRMSAEKGSLEIDAANLILLLQGKIYPDYACNSIEASVSRSAIAEIQNSVRSRVLELTLAIDKSIPEAASVSFGVHQHGNTIPEKVQQISQQIIYGNVTTAVAGSSETQINVEAHDIDGFIRYLCNSGITMKDASDLANIVLSEQPASREEPFGQNAKKWIVENIKKATDGTWKVGIAVATEVIKEGIFKFYGLK